MSGNRRNPEFGRREFVQGLGAAGLVAPFLRAGKAKAQGGVARNLVLFTWPDGLEEGWEPTGKPEEFTFSPTVAALEPLKDDLLIITGMKSGITNELAAHGEGPRILWTGAAEVNAAADNHSIDQEIANSFSGQTAIPSLHFGVQTTELGKSSTISQPYCHFAGPNQPIPAEDDPTRTYAAVFGGGANLDQAAIAKIKRERGGVLNYLKERVSTIRGQISAADRVKMDQHLAGIESIERGLQFLGNVECNVDHPTPTQTGDAAIRDDRVFPEVAKIQMDLSVVALQCGLTRVATIQLSNTDSATKIPGVNPNLGLHQVMHERTKAEKVAINTWMMQQLAYYIGALKAVDLGDGKTLLDDTLVVAGTEMAIGNHKNQPMPFFIAGGGGGYFKLGRWVHLANFPRHTKLLTSVCHAFGLNHIQTFGKYTDPSSTGDLGAEVS